jgi:hypothetical protein
MNAKIGMEVSSLPVWICGTVHVSLFCRAISSYWDSRQQLAHYQEEEEEDILRILFV